MLTFFMWAFLAAIIFGAARGIADGGRLVGGPLVAVWVVAFLVYGGIFSYFSPWEGDESESLGADASQKTCESPSAAYSMTKKFVEDSLRSPSTAEFPSIFSDDVTTSYVGDCTHQITAYVDSQNGFGAMIRTHFLAEVKNDHGTSTWRLKDLVIR